MSLQKSEKTSAATRFKFLKSLIGSAVRPNTRARICFIHVPKCGGTSFDWAMRECVGLLERIGGAVGHVEADASARAAEALQVNRFDFRDGVLNYELLRRRCRFVSGHCRFHPGMIQAYPGWSFVTVLREPVSRWLSLYFYGRYKTTGLLRHNMELDKFLESERAEQAGQAYVTHFSGLEGSNLNERIESARRNLDKFDVVGVLERPEEFCRAFARQFGVRLRIPRRNVTPRELRPFEPSAQQLERIERLCEPDRVVYDYVFRMAT